MPTRKPRRPKSRMGRPPLSESGAHERVNVTLPPDVLDYLATLGPSRSTVIATIVRESRDRKDPKAT